MSASGGLTEAAWPAKIRRAGADSRKERGSVRHAGKCPGRRRNARPIRAMPEYRRDCSRKPALQRRRSRRRARQRATDGQSTAATTADRQLRRNASAAGKVGRHTRTVTLAPGSKGTSMRRGRPPSAGRLILARTAIHRTRGETQVELALFQPQGTRCGRSGLLAASLSKHPVPAARTSVEAKTGAAPALT